MIKSLLLTQLAISITNGPQNTDGMRIALYSDLIKKEKELRNITADTVTTATTWKRHIHMRYIHFSCCKLADILATAQEIYK